MLDHEWVWTHGGKKVCPWAMRAKDIDIHDIAWHLSNINRFTGASTIPWSVAQHSVAVAKATESLEGLLHDASEAYLTDISRPLKRWSGMASYKIAEEICCRAIAEKFGLKFPWPGKVHRADERVYAWEAKHLIYPNLQNITLSDFLKEQGLPNVPGPGPTYNTPGSARRQFLAMFFEMGGKE